MISALAERARVSLQYHGECAAQTAMVSLRHRLGRRRADHGLVILDDYFPNLLTGFRVSEFNEYLRRDPESRVYSCAPRFRADIGPYRRRHPAYASRVSNWHPFVYLPGSLAYCVFLNNAHRFLPVIERRQLPFVFTLYPGGGFRLDDPWSDTQLRGVCGSPWFRRVIVTQTISRDYLLEKGFCRPEQVELIYGGVFPSDVFGAGSARKQYYGADKGTLDLCFAAHKYMPGGIDKGYDVFLEVARLLAQEFSEARFHVIGGFGPGELDITGLEDRITFHGSLYRDRCRELYRGMDLILSPNVPFRLYEGGFDGFPTGCCIEAGMAGVAVFCTDELDSNIAFAEGEEIVVIPRDTEAIAARVAAFLREPDRLYRLAAAGQQAFRRVFDLQAQMAPRFRILSECAG